MRISLRDGRVILYLARTFNMTPDDMAQAIVNLAHGYQMTPQAICALARKHPAIKAWV